MKEKDLCIGFCVYCNKEIYYGKGNYIFLDGKEVIHKGCWLDKVYDPIPRGEFDNFSEGFKKCEACGG